MDSLRQYTVIIPTFHSSNLGGVIDALEKQSLRNAIIEILLVGQQPDWEILNGRVKYIPVENEPTSARNRNIGASLAVTEWICFLDSDCIPDVHWLERVDQKINQGESAVAGAVNVPNEHSYWSRCDYIAGFFSQISDLSRSDYLDYVTMTNFSVRKEVFLKLGGFDEEFTTTGEDREFCWRLTNNGTKISFARDAIIVHDHSREQFGETWTHLFDFGRGTARFRMKHFQATTRKWRIGYGIIRIPLLGEIAGILRVILTWLVKIILHPSILRFWKYLPGVILLNIAHTLGMIYTLRTYAPKN
jgi:O-antigen biosynthesis protein